MRKKVIKTTALLAVGLLIVAAPVVSSQGTDKFVISLLTAIASRLDEEVLPLKGKVDSLETKVRGLEARLAALETGTTPPPKKVVSGLGKWKISESTDELTGVSSKTAYLVADKDTGDDEWLYSKSDLNVRCKGGNLDVFVWFGGRLAFGSFSSGDIAVEYRFDDGSLVSENWGESTSNESAFAPNPRTFVSSLKTSSKLVFRAWDFDQDEITTSTFDTSGASAAIPSC